MRSDKILVTGANGQIGSVLTSRLREVFGTDNVLGTDIREPEVAEGPFEILNAMDDKRMAELIDRYQITQIYHLVAILSAKGEAAPLQTWDINMGSLLKVLELARSKNISKVFFPSSIAVFGPNAPHLNTPQEAVLNPTTVYGMSKVAGENWCNYFYQRFKVDVRSVRYPGIIGYEGMPGGGTTDYAVDIFHKAVNGEVFDCFLRDDTALPMLYMPDAIKGTLQLMEAPADQIKLRTSYNLSGLSFTPAELTEAIRQHIPDFKITYQPDFRQAIADSWPSSIDDSPARQDWHWQESFDLAAMTKDMIYQLRLKYKITESKV